MDKEITGMNCHGVSYISKRSDTEFHLETRDNFVSEMTNPLKTIDGTIGEFNRRYLHKLLDEWIDNATKSKQG